MAVSKPKRLSKVAKELNVGISTIVEYLGEKGHEVSSSPNTKLDGELFGLLLDKFQKDKGVKEDAKKVSITRETKETITIEKKFVEEEVNEVVAEAPAPVAEPEPTPAPVVEEVKEDKPVFEPVESVDEDGNGPKVLGKLDLDNIKDPRKLAKERKEEKKKQEQLAKQKAAAEKKAASEAKAKAASEAKAKAADDAKAKAANVVADKKAKEEAAKPVEKPAVKKAETEVIKATAGKIDGPKVLGKIELPVEKKKPVASSSDDAKKKRKRKRIRPEGTGSGPGNAGGNRTGGPGRSAAGSRADGNRAGGNRRGRKPEPKAELTEEEVSKKIKETLARLSGGGKKNKAAKYRRDKREEGSKKRQEEAEQQELEKSILKVTEFVSANELASLMDVQINDIIAACMSLGLFVSINQRLDAETISIVAEEFGFEVEFISAEDQESIEEEVDNEEDLLERPPIITVMGHVDHGKTSLLDYIRKENVIAGEAGGITQHIGAYMVEVGEDAKKIAFLDTPGHEAFTAMRARGAQVTDLVIIVIAADDQVMPQTKEAINHAQAAGVPMIFAINKIDKPGANADKVREELSAMNILVEDWGGKYQCQEISAKKGLHIEELLEKVILEADMLELKANPNKPAIGTIVESSLDKGRGYVTNIMVQSGTLKVGDIIVAGSYNGRVKAMFNERNQKINEAGPSTPVVMLGLNGAPQAGDKFNILKDEKEAREIATKRLQLQREQGQRAQKRVSLDEIGRRLAIGDFKELNLILKGDVDGSVEALSDSLLKLSTEQVQVNIIHKSVGQISDSDVLLASASDAIIIGFQVRPSASARKIAEKEDVDVNLYSIIYDAIEEVKSAMEGMLSAKIEEKVVCNVEVRETFKISKVGTIAGCYVTDGTISRNTMVRIIRDGIVVHTGELGSLKRFKDDVKEVKFGYECGLNIEKFNDIQIGDIIEGYEEVEVKQKL
ncbi:translation initiation factor IF-2 [bacterium]|nr:translation initiation factor IF-2 [bacterium]